jgi:hypothetical protein
MFHLAFFIGSFSAVGSKKFSSFGMDCPAQKKGADGKMVD